jgi:hypothetical protein
VALTAAGRMAGAVVSQAVGIVCLLAGVWVALVYTVWAARPNSHMAGHRIASLLKGSPEGEGVTHPRQGL